jgi:uncharacterized protein YgiM (DUF1202 family)
MGAYTNWIMDLLSKDNANLKNENKQLKELIQKFNKGEYDREKLIQEYQTLSGKENSRGNKI